jgi:hypothetical protein
MSTLITLDSIAARVKMDRGWKTSRYDLKIKQLAIDCLVDLNMFVNGDVAFATLTVNDNNTADLPDDFMKYRKVAVNSSGRMCVLRIDDDLTFRETGDKQWCDDTAIEETDSSSSGLWYFPDYRNGQYVGERYGANQLNTSIPRFRINPKTRRIELATNSIISSIALEYISTGLSGDANTCIKREFLQVILAWIHWKLDEYNDKKSLGEKARKEQLYEKEYRKAQFFSYSFTMEDFMDALYGGSSSSVKY